MKPKSIPSSRPLSRRGFLHAGALVACGLTLPELLRMRSMASAAGQAERDTAVILVWLPGGPPHMETYDMKPDAPSDYRGEFSPMKTNVRGIEVCELLPLHAQCADKYSIIRSIAHDFADHGGGHKRFLTGRVPQTPVEFVNDSPSVQSIIGLCREGHSPGLPDSVACIERGDCDTFAFGAAYLGSQNEPFLVVGDPAAKGFEVQNIALPPHMANRLDDRQSLLQGLDRLRREIDASGAMRAMDKFNGKALEMLTSPAARIAFDLEREAPAVRERYGRHSWGQRALMSRRLVEAGCSFVTCMMENPTPGKALPDNVVYNWDSHAVNAHIFEDFRFRAPYYDQAVTALIEDIYARGLDKKVMVVVTGEFGRTPKITRHAGTVSKVTQPGRDHWPQAMSILVSGGGMRMGQVIGSTNAKGEHPHERPMTPNDLWATVYRHLGIDYNLTFDDHKGRPQFILPFGEPIRELI